MSKHDAGLLGRGWGWGWGWAAAAAPGKGARPLHVKAARGKAAESQPSVASCRPCQLPAKPLPIPLAQSSPCQAPTRIPTPLPTLLLADLDPQTPIIPTQLSAATDGMEEQLSHEIPTTGIVYLDLALDLRGVPQELLQLVPLFAT